MTYRFTLAYDGTDFLGWQRQPNVRTVQGEIEATLSEILQQKVICNASGRTDSGVHALGQVVAFDAVTDIPPAAIGRALNASLPNDLQVYELTRVRDGFDPIRDALFKRYRYVIEDGRERDLFDRHYLWHIYRKLDDVAMKEAAQALVGTHDFTTYQTNGSARISTIRTIYDLKVERITSLRTPRIVIEVEANGFLYNMVRNIVGTLAFVGQGRFPVSYPGEILEKKDRTLAGMSAPPQGLFMLYVVYDDEAHNNPDAELEIATASDIPNESTPS